MTSSFSKKQLSLAVACALALGFVSSAARAQAPLLPPSERQLVIDTRNQVWKNGYGECWHSGFGPPPLSTAECDPNYRPVAQVVVPAPQPVAVAAPAPQPAPAARPAPQAVVAAVTPARRPVVEKVTLDADTLFDFDKSVLRPEGRSALDGIVGKLQGVDLDSMTAVGHTDRFGSERYNQALSDRRAQAVKTYMVAKGIPANRVRTEAKGETQPVTKAGDCMGAKSVKVVACLQPDRRVDLDVVGTRTTP